MKAKLPLVARILLGLIFFVFGTAGLFQLLPPPKDLPATMEAFMTGLMATGYFFPLLKGTESICGLLLLIGVYVPLALVVLAPIVLNIFLLHAFIAPDGLILAIVIGLLEIYLAFFAKPYATPIKALFQRKAQE